MATVEKLQEHLKKTQSNLAEASKKDDAGEIRKTAHCIGRDCTRSRTECPLPLHHGREVQVTDKLVEHNPLP